MEVKEYLGKTVEDAVNEGLKELGIEKEDAEIVILDEGSKGLFKSRKARVTVEKKKTNGEKAVIFLEGLFEKMNINAAVKLRREEDKIEIDVYADDSSTIIGYRGEMLDALQNLAGAVANTGNEIYKRVVVDCENYREKRDGTLENLAQNLEKKAVRTGRDVKLEPMSAYERRVIHSALAESTEVTTMSEGKEPNRYVVIVPNVKKEFKPREGGYRKDYNNGYKKDYSREGKPYNKDGYKPYNKDGYKPYNKDGYKPYNKDGFKPYNKEGGAEGYNKDGYRKDYGDRRNGGYDRRNNGGFKKYGEDGASAQRKKTITFGTYLGNSGAGQSTTVTENTDKTEE